MGRIFKNTSRNEVKVSELASDRIKEAFENVTKDEVRKVEHRQRNHDKKHRFLATHHPASGRARRCYDVILLLPPCNSFPMEDYVWWVSG